MAGTRTAGQSDCARQFGRSKITKNRESTMFRVRIQAFIATTLLVLMAGAAGAKDSHQHANCPLAGAHGGSACEGSEARPIDVPALQEVGQDSFAAVAEMLRRLETDPSVDWTSVRLDRLREHLIDMDRVMSRADVEVMDLPGGFRARVTSTDAWTAAAIDRMVPAHGRMMNGHQGWRVDVTSLDDKLAGVLLEVRATDPAEVVRLHALGFAGFLVSGDHHRPHHLAMTLGAGH